MSAVPYTFAHRTGNIQLEELDINFANVKAYANTAGLVLTGNQYNITRVGTLVTLTVTGNVAAGNVSATNFTSTSNITAASITSSGNITAASISSSGNVIAINLNGSALAVSSATVYGNLAGINGSFTNNLSANTANVTTLTSVTVETNFLRSPDSTIISINDGLEVYGNTTVNGVVAANSAAIPTVETNFIRSTDSTLVNIEDGVEVYGDAIVNGNVIANNFVSNGSLAVLSSINRIIYVSNVAPTSGDGNDGDIWLQTV